MFIGGSFQITKASLDFVLLDYYHPYVILTKTNQSQLHPVYSYPGVIVIAMRNGEKIVAQCSVL